MKRLLLIGLICVASVHGALAQHYISLSGQLGEHSWVGDMPDAITNGSFGLGTGVGVNYELKYRHFLFSVGVSGNYSRSTLFSQQSFVQNANDADNSFGHKPTVDGVRGDFLYVYDFYRRKDNYSNVTLQVPLMMGGTWNKFYFLLGAKFETFSLWGDWNASAIFDSHGEYSSILGTSIAHMPEYGFYDYEKVEMPSAAASFKLNVLASAELGYWIVPQVYASTMHKSTHNVYRVGAYIDCGALNAYEYDENLTPFVTPVYDANNPTAMKDVELVDYLSTGSRGTHVLPLQVGVKFTVMFELPSKRPCVLCGEVAPNPRPARNGGRIATENKKSKK